MKHTVYFFSGTGNFLAVVKELEKKGAHAASMSALADEKVICDSEKVGFVFPVYYLGLPQIVHDFLDKIEFSNTRYIYAVYTMGWNLRGGVTKQLKTHLAVKKLKLNMSSYIQMPMNDFTYANVHNKNQQQKILGRFDAEIKKITDRIAVEKQYLSAEPIGFMVEKHNKPFCSECNGNDTRFAVSDACSGCEICAKVCPVNNITLQNKKPNWNHKCQSCMACFHYCPKKAISYGGKGEAITHYHHPKYQQQSLKNITNRFNTNEDKTPATNQGCGHSFPYIKNLRKKINPNSSKSSDLLIGSPDWT